MKLAIVGIQGLPNSYGGFETLAEQLVAHLGDDLDITVYCSSKDMVGKPAKYLNAKLSYIPISSHGGAGIIYDSLSLMSAVKKNDKVLFLGFGGGFVIPFLKKHKPKIILNIGGLDWKRNKWSPRAQKVIRKAEALLVKYSNKIISDNVGIQKYFTETYGKESLLIEYGGDQANQKAITPQSVIDYPFLKDKYAFIVTRIQQDNNIDMLLDAFENQDEMPLVIVGNWKGSEYGIATKAKYLGRKNLIILDAIYDREILDILRSNCSLYVHGHSAGGTNPSLVEAMYLGLPIFAFASGYNEYTTHNEALYFNDAAGLTTLVKNYQQYDLASMGIKLKKIADESYRWSVIAAKYKAAIESN